MVLVPVSSKRQDSKAYGLALSAQFGVRDNNEASWTQVVEMKIPWNYWTKFS